MPTPGKVDGKRHKNLAQSCRPEKKKNQTELKGGKRRFCFYLLIPAEAFYVHLTADIWLPQPGPPVRRTQRESPVSAAMLQPGLASDDFSYRDDNNEDSLVHVCST